MIGIIPGVENMPLQIRRGTEAERTAMTQPLAQGELLYVTNDQRLYIGNGSTLGGVQITGYTNEDAQDAAAQIFSNGTHTGITFTYNDTSASMSAVLDLSNFSGTVRADAFKGSVFADDGSTIGGTLLVDAVDGVLRGPHIGNVTGNVTGNVAGVITGTAGSTLVGNVTGNVTGNITGNVTGNVTGNSIGYHTGDVSGSIFADDSTLLVDGVTGRLSNGTLTLQSSTILNTDTQLTVDSDLIVNGTSANDVSMQINSVITGTAGIGQTGSLVRLASFNGTYAAKTVLAVDEVCGSLQFAGFVNSGAFGTTTADMSAIRSVVTVAGNTSTNYAKGKLQFIIANQDSPPDFKLAEFDHLGVFSAPILKPGVYANNAARDAAITAPAAGMIVFNTTGTKFQGYTGAAWVDLN